MIVIERTFEWFVSNYKRFDEENQDADELQLQGRMEKLRN